MADFDADVIWWFSPGYHVAPDLTNGVTTTTLNFNIARADSVFLADDGLRADQIVTGVHSYSKVLTQG